MNSEILDKVDDIIKTIEESSEYQKYVELKEKISKNKELMKLINEVKVLQKDVVHHVKDKSILKNKMDELNNDPLYREYNNTLSEINNTFAIVENTLNNYFNKKLN